MSLSFPSLDSESLAQQKSDAKSSSVKPKKLFSKLTTGFLVVWIIGLFIAAQLIGVYLFTPYVLGQTNMSAAQRFALGSFNGTVTSYAMLLTLGVLSVFIFGMVFLKIILSRKKHLKQYPVVCHEGVIAQNSAQPAAQTDKHSSSWQQTLKYLAIRGFSLRSAWVMFALWGVFLVVSEMVTYWLDKDPSAFVDILYDSANPKWLLMLVMIVIAPIYEELMFRGLLWSALREQLKGKSGIWFASIVTSLLFAIIHFQYDWYEISVIFVLALLLSLARSRSGSLLLPMAIHIANNGIAMWQYLMFIG